MKFLVHVIFYQSLMSERRVAALAEVIAVPDSFTFTQPPELRGESQSGIVSVTLSELWRWSHSKIR